MTVSFFAKVASAVISDVAEEQIGIDIPVRFGQILGPTHLEVYDWSRIYRESGLTIRSITKLHSLIDESAS